MTTDPKPAAEIGECLWANQICEQPNHHGCKTCLAVAPAREVIHDADCGVPTGRTWGCACNERNGYRLIPPATPTPEEGQTR